MVSLKMAFTIPFKEMVELISIFIVSELAVKLFTPSKISYAQMINDGKQIKRTRDSRK